MAKQLGDADLNVWKFDEEKCLSWLTDRVEAVAKVGLYKVQPPPLPRGWWWWWGGGGEITYRSSNDFTHKLGGKINRTGIREKASNEDTGPELVFASLKPDTM